MECSAVNINPQKTRQVDSVGKRYIITLFSNAIFFFVSLVTAGIVPRALGPRQLGDFSFLSRVSNAIRNFFDIGSSSALFNYNSKHEHTGPLVKIYSIWAVSQLVIILSLILIAALMGIKGLIWPGQQLKYILWITVLDWILFLVSIFKEMSDSKGYTTPAQLINLGLGLANIILLVFFALKGLLNLNRYIAIQTLCSALISLGILFWIIIPHRDLYWQGKIERHLFKEYWQYFYRFCSPLVAIIIISFIFEYFDRMILQRFSGSIQQGYFHIASGWSAFATLFTASILAIYKREMANSLGRDDVPAARGMFCRYLKMMYFLTLTMSVFLAFNARELLSLIAGPQFQAATVTLIIMAFFPIHAAYGQLGQSTLYATERTAILRNITLVSLFSVSP